MDALVIVAAVVVGVVFVGGSFLPLFFILTLLET